MIGGSEKNGNKGSFAKNSIFVPYFKICLLIKNNYKTL